MSNLGRSLMAKQGYTEFYEDDLIISFYNPTNYTKILFRKTSRMYYPSIFDVTPELHCAIYQVMKDLGWIKEEEE